MGINGPLTSKAGGGRALGDVGQGPGLQQPLQAGHALGGRRPPVALLVNARSATPPRREVGRTGEAASRQQEDGSRDGVSQLEEVWREIQVR